MRDFLIMLVFICICALISCFDREKSNAVTENHHQQRQEETQCLNISDEHDKAACKKSIEYIEGVLSETGKKYFKGMLCKKNCSRHQDGYEWAWELGITQEDACYRKSASFSEGCLAGVKDVILELREYLKNEYPEDCENYDTFVDDEVSTIPFL